MSWRQDAPCFSALSSSLPTGRARLLAAPAVILLALAAAGAAAVAGGAAHAPAGRRSPWLVSITTPGFGALYPGGPPVSIVFTITSNRDDATLHHVTAGVAVDGGSGDVETGSGAPIPGCPARWFTLTPAPGTPPPPVHFHDAGDAYRERIDLAMTDPPVDQDACLRGAPAVTVAAS
jgi:hypothetical protein